MTIGCANYIAITAELVNQSNKNKQYMKLLGRQNILHSLEIITVKFPYPQ